MANKLAFTFFLIFLAAQPCRVMSASGSMSNEERLFEQLVEKYGYKVQPVNCTLYMKVAMLCISVYETSHSMTARVSEVYEWYDPKLGWNPEDFGGLQHTSLPNDLVWIPSVTLVNAMTVPEKESMMEVVVRSTGKVTWLKPANYYLSFEKNVNNTKVPVVNNIVTPFIGRMRFIPASRTVDDINFEFMGTGVENKYIAECLPYVLARYRTRKSIFTTVNGKHHQLEIEFGIRKIDNEN